MLVSYGSECVNSVLWSCSAVFIGIIHQTLLERPVEPDDLNCFRTAHSSCPPSSHPVTTPHFKVRQPDLNSTFSWASVSRLQWKCGKSEKSSGVNVQVWMFRFEFLGSNVQVFGIYVHLKRSPQLIVPEVHQLSSTLLKLHLNFIWVYNFILQSPSAPSSSKFQPLLFL